VGDVGKTARKLAVIMHADVVASTELVRRNESIAHDRIQHTFRRLSEAIEAYGGTTHELRGDALLAEFPRASDAVSASLAFQAANVEHNSAIEDDIRPEVRIGISLGEVIIADDTLTGPDVVLAQRLEQLAAPSGLCISQAAYQSIPRRLPFDYEDFGDQQVKGFDDPVRAYSVTLREGESIPEVDHPAPAGKSRTTVTNRRWIFGGIATCLLVFVVLLVWLKPWTASNDSISDQHSRLSLPEKPSIAVLPFDNLSGHPENEHMVDGLSEHIISALARIPEMFVIARNSTFVYKGKPVEIRQVAEDLGVQYVLEGSLQASGDRIRVTAQLIDAVNGHHVWTEQYDRKLDDYFALQDDITQQVAKSVLAELAWGERVYIESTSATDLTAWLLIQQAYEYFRTYSRDGIAKSRKLVRESLERDPDNPQAWAFLGWTHAIDAGLGYSESRSESLNLSHEYADKVATIDPNYVELINLRRYLYMIQREYDPAVTLGRQLLEVAGGNAQYNAAVSMTLMYAGELDESIWLMNKARRLSPRHPAWYDLMQGRAYTLKRDYEAAAATFQRIATEETSGFMAAGAHAGLAVVYSETGRDDEAAREIGKALQRAGWLTIAFYRDSMYFKNPAHWERFETGMRNAGLPEGDE